MTKTGTIRERVASTLSASALAEYKADLLAEIEANWESQSGSSLIGIVREVLAPEPTTDLKVLLDHFGARAAAGFSNQGNVAGFYAIENGKKVGRLVFHGGKLVRAFAIRNGVEAEIGPALDNVKRYFA